ncbi:MAG: succinylglutamate desuccinylase/aspartoacylase family protein [Cyanobacteria bacterium HKST-UBA06]|nr:succinylglutamate desuccinylase/aspartoacylase family protein [Cyanobacteria bacterium HKST-UBA06]
MSNDADVLEIAGSSVQVGQRVRLNIPVATAFDSTPLHMPVEVIRGKKPGPALFISAAIHGDEIIGTEVIKALLMRKRLLASIRGTLILVPIVNVFGYNRNVRYLPDRRDLNRCFPGAEHGSLAGQFAYTFMHQIVRHCTHGIDLHTGAVNRTNLPQIRASLDDPETRQLAQAFGVPVVLNADVRDGSLRQAVKNLGIPMLLFEGGEALRVEKKVVQSALNGIIHVMRLIEMLPSNKRFHAVRSKHVYIAHNSHWLRAPQSGCFQTVKQLGHQVEKGEPIARITDPFGDEVGRIVAQATGIIIGMSTLPLVTNGEAVFHVATFKDSDAVEEQLETYEDALLDTI